MFSLISLTILIIIFWNLRFHTLSVLLWSCWVLGESCCLFIFLVLSHISCVSASGFVHQRPSCWLEVLINCRAISHHWTQKPSLCPHAQGTGPDPQHGLDWGKLAAVSYGRVSICFCVLLL
jgi:hypothetical protein